MFDEKAFIQEAVKELKKVEGKAVVAVSGALEELIQALWQNLAAWL